MVNGLAHILEFSRHFTNKQVKYITKQCLSDQSKQDMHTKISVEEEINEQNVGPGQQWETTSNMHQTGLVVPVIL